MHGYFLATVPSQLVRVWQLFQFRATCYVRSLSVVHKFLWVIGSRGMLAELEKTHVDHEPQASGLRILRVFY